ncbi:PilN domain-containing protein [Endozoicomonas sp. 4G]|uniref:PilN domain-containing protein n=1 Tax=Endozoicomonas sp. 4G TaxID=2872754 RepID=UPI002078F6C3|nr:PilN domain-containing protein [Endozoicomonas sp. 4G]
MARINLLPWREQLREERKKRFFAVWMMTILAAGSVIFMADLYTGNVISEQQNRNQYLQNKIIQLDKSIAEIKGLREKRAQLLERMEVIQSLQGNRPIIVRVFDQLARLIPDGVHFKSLQYQGDTLKLVGVAESNNRISSLMRNFDASEWFSDPNLTAVRKVTLGGNRMNEFDLTVIRTSPEKEGGDES